MHERLKAGLGFGVLAATAAVAGCGSTVVTSGGSGGSTGSGHSGPTSSSSSSTSSGVPPAPPADKIDLLFMIDNSSSMADKQRVLALAASELVVRFTNPLCIDSNGVAAPTPVGNPTDPCPQGYAREFKPVDDINIGIVDSSLGGMGSDACPDNLSGYQNNDGAHLVARSSTNTPTYMGQGFLAWDAKGTRGGITDPLALRTAVQSLISGVDEKGCGYEQPLEAIARFLVVPHPYATLSKGTGGIPPVTPMGEDQTLLQQRAAFLRPDSALVIVALTDENDFSINWLGPQDYAPWNSMPFYRSSSVCSSLPGDKCCYSCGLGPPSGCMADPVCATSPLYSTTEDPVNLKESQPKKKYGFDPNFPVKRYVNAFTQAMIDPTRADLGVIDPQKAVANPIFSDLSGQGRPTRDPSQVFFAAIVGVPYQAITRPPGSLVPGLMNADELTHSDFWVQYVGDPDSYIPPTSPIMQESSAQRPGVTAGAPNGGDRNLGPTPNDIQFACIFPLSTPNPTGIDCQVPDSPNNPLCTMGHEPQLNAKAYPGLRELSVANGLGQQGIVASICPSNTSDPSLPDFGYRPAAFAIVERMRGHLAK